MSEFSVQLFQHKRRILGIPPVLDEAGSVLRVIFAEDDNFSAPLTALEVTRSAGLL